MLGMSRWNTPTVIYFKVYWAIHFLQNTDVVGFRIFIKGSFVQIIAGSFKNIRTVSCVLIWS